MVKYNEPSLIKIYTPQQQKTNYTYFKIVIIKFQARPDTILIMEIPSVLSGRWYFTLALRYQQECDEY